MCRHCQEGKQKKPNKIIIWKRTEWHQQAHVRVLLLWEQEDEHRFALICRRLLRSMMVPPFVYPKRSTKPRGGVDPKRIRWNEAMYRSHSFQNLVWEMFSRASGSSSAALQHSLSSKTFVSSMIEAVWTKRTLLSRIDTNSHDLLVLRGDFPKKRHSV